MVLSTVMRIKRTLDGAEIIWDVETRKALALGRARRADCKSRELSARAFLADLKSHE
jgi:hypothetical protein